VLRLVLRRIVFVVPIVILVSFLVFGLVYLVPGDPATTLAGDSPTKEQVAEIRQQLGLDDPIWVQYGRWAGNAVHGDFGESLYSGRSVGDAIAERMPVTLSVAGLAVVVALLIAVPAGLVAATRRGRWPDSVATVAATLGLAMPSFFLGLLLVLVFAIKLDWLPATGYVGITKDPVQWLRHMALPAVTLGGAVAAETTRQLRSSMIDVLQQDYIRTARAKGLRWPAVLTRHSLKNAAGPVITVMGFQIAFLLGGSVIVEQIFALPGLGTLSVDAVLNRDLPMIQAVVLLTAVIVIVVNLLVDVMYGWLNPKVRAA
jgi:peptide/nickel transport system permease protein